MRLVIFCHSLVSCWNHGNAHFLRGLASEFLARGHEARVLEPRTSWSARNLLREHGREAVRGFHRAYPSLSSVRYGPGPIDLDRALDGADLVLVHEWNDPELVERIGDHRRRNPNYRLLFHDTHHRAATDPESMGHYRLRDYDGVLAFGAVIRDIYLARGWCERAWTFHEAADIRVFAPVSDEPLAGDLVWIGNWGDEERGAELDEFLLRPSKELGLRTRVHGVRYPAEALAALHAAGIEYARWLPNHEAPREFARFRVTVHVPRRPYAASLPGIPTIRPFEAMACGIPLVSAPWNDVEGLFRPGRDYLTAANGAEMTVRLREVLNDPGLARSLADEGRRTILAHHTCGHRVDQLLQIHRDLSGRAGPKPNEREALA